MTSSSQVQQARKMNHEMIKALKAGNVETAGFCRKLRMINMHHAGMLQLQGK